MERVYDKFDFNWVETFFFYGYAHCEITESLQMLQIVWLDYKWLSGHILGSIVVSIPACHAGDRGSIPRRGGYIFRTFPILILNRVNIIYFNTTFL